MFAAQVRPPLTRAGLDCHLETLARSDKPLPDLRRLSKALSLPELESVCGVTALREAKAHLLEAQHYLAQTRGPLPITLRSRLSDLFDQLVSILESFIDAFGIATFFEPSKNEWHASLKESKIMSLFYNFGGLSALLIPLLGAELGAMIIGGSLLGIAGLSVIFEKIRPPSTYLPRGDNWSLEYRNGKLETGQARKSILNRVAQTLISAQTKKRFPLLVGQSGIGKTEVVKSLVEAIERGDYPELKGKTVVYFNTANLIQHYDGMGGGNTILSKIRERMGRHAERFIIILDEFHNVEKKDGEGATILGEQLKTLLDPSSRGFPYVIGLTTPEECKRVLEPKLALMRRFEKIEVTAPIREETLAILQNACIRHAPHLHLAESALPHLLDRLPREDPQPGRSLEILSRCFEKASESQESPLASRIDTLRTRLDCAAAARASGVSDASVSALETELAALEQEAQRLEPSFKAFYAKRRHWAEIKGELARTTVAVASSPHKTNQVALLLLQELGRFLEQALPKEAARLHIQTEITPALIDAELPK